MSECGRQMHDFFMERTEEYKQKMSERKKLNKIVVQPEHYQRYAVEPITFIMQNSLPFWAGNVVKYIARAGHKQYGDLSTTECEKIDIRKAIRYCEMRLNELDGRSITDER